jgi:AT hook motif
MEIKCLECNKSVPQTLGKRTKIFCGSTCRTKYWKKEKDAGKEKKKRGRPKKDITASPKKVYDAAKSTKVQDEPKPNVETTVDNNMFMGHKIPKGLKGIELSIWKAEIKEGK